MPTQRFKNLWIDSFNEEIERLSGLSVSKGYREIVDNVLKDVYLETSKKGVLTRRELRSILNRHSLTVKVFNKSIINHYIGSGVTLIVQNDKLSKADMRRLQPVREVLGKNPITTARNINTVSNGIINNGTGVSTSLLPAFKVLNDYIVNRNAKSIQKIAVNYKEEIVKLNRKITTNLSKNIIRDMRRFKTEKGKPITFKRLSEKLQDKYEKVGVKASYVARIVDTEMHAQNELIKGIDASSKGFKFKIWRTQGDNAVRNSHKRLNKVKIPIGKKFNVGGHGAMYPSDLSLPAKERINCRCYNTYTN